MLPTEMFSGDATPAVPWTPLVWQEGPDGLLADAQGQLWQDHQEITTGVLGTGDRAMSGSQTAPQNESDQMINGATPGDSPSGSDSGGGRAATWANQVRDLYRTEPLAAWATGAKDGPANPQ